jgi:hypothetical protein
MSAPVNTVNPNPGYPHLTHGNHGAHGSDMLGSGVVLARLYEDRQHHYPTHPSVYSNAIPNVYNNGMLQHPHPHMQMLHPHVQRLPHQQGSLDGRFGMGMGVPWNIHQHQNMPVPAPPNYSAGTVLDRNDIAGNAYIHANISASRSASSTFLQQCQERRQREQEQLKQQHHSSHH